MAKSKTQQMIDHYTELIESGQLKPGEKLPSHAQLREEFGVSITVVRQAMQWLKAAGLVEGVHGLGTFVTERPRPGHSAGKP